MAQSPVPPSSSGSSHMSGPTYQQSHVTRTALTVVLVAAAAESRHPAALQAVPEHLPHQVQAILQVQADVLEVPIVQAGSSSLTRPRQSSSASHIYAKHVHNISPFMYLVRHYHDRGLLGCPEQTTGGDFVAHRYSRICIFSQISIAPVIR